MLLWHRRLTSPPLFAGRFHRTLPLIARSRDSRDLYEIYFTKSVDRVRRELTDDFSPAGRARAVAKAAALPSMGTIFISRSLHCGPANAENLRTVTGWQKSKDSSLLESYPVRWSV
jgi:hypothetical protein